MKKKIIPEIMGYRRPGVNFLFDRMHLLVRKDITLRGAKINQVLKWMMSIPEGTKTKY